MLADFGRGRFGRERHDGAHVAVVATVAAVQPKQFVIAYEVSEGDGRDYYIMPNFLPIA